MKIQFLNGGLANQVFQYVFTRFAEMENPDEEPFFLDDSFFFVEDIHNGYELEQVFGINANLLSKYFDADVWEEFIRNKRNGISIPQSLKQLGFDVQMVAEVNHNRFNPFDGKLFKIPANEFHPEIIKIPGEITYYHGYWLSLQWFEAYRNRLTEEFAFPEISDVKNQSYALHILDSESVAVHVRRGDYVTLGWSLPGSYYFKAVRKLYAEHPNAVFFVFSDDIEWCRNHASELGLNVASEVVYIEGNTTGLNYIDLQLMSMCKGMVMSNSAFCNLAVLLNKRLSYYTNSNSGEY